MPGRIRVLVAGEVSLTPALVTPFLEDDGYEVVGETSTPAEALAAIAERRPDAIAIDDRLLLEDAGLLRAIRTSTPDAKVIVLTSSAAGAALGADAALEKGRTLTDLSVSIGRSLGGPIDTDARAGGTADGAEADGVAAAVGRFVATVGAPVLLVWTLVAALATGSGISVPPADTTDLGRAIVAQQQEDHLDDARLALDEMIDAIRAGRYVMATVHARVLMDERKAALALGLSTGALDALITLRLEAVAGLLPISAIADLQAILGALFPVLPEEGTPGGGSGLILGPALGTGSSNGGGGGGDGGGGTGGDGSDEGEEGSDEGEDGADEGEDGADVTLGPGDGKEWGQSHEPRGDRGGPPPRAEGDHRGRGDEHRHEGGGEGGGEAGHEHGHGHGSGQQTGHGKGHDGNG